MIISKHDILETTRIGALVIKIDNIDNEYVNTITDEINLYQPFLISMLLGFRIDLKPEEVEEVIKLVFIIWEFFKENNNIKKKKLTEQQFERLEKRNIGLLKYLEGASEPEEKLDITSSDLDHLRSKALLTGIFYRFDTRVPLMKMDAKAKGILMIGLKSLIECFEEIGK